MIEQVNAAVRPFCTAVVTLTLCAAFLRQAFAQGVDVKDVFAGALGVMVGVYFAKREAAGPPQVAILEADGRSHIGFQPGGGNGPA